jgi:hypothetical protein
MIARLSMASATLETTATPNPARSRMLRARLSLRRSGSTINTQRATPG